MRVDLDNPEILTAVGGVIERLESLVPSLFMGLNVAQYRALRDVYTEYDRPGSGGEKSIPDLGIVEFANGAGKSHLLILDMVGWALGPEYLDRASFPPEALKVYERVRKLRDAGKLSLRLVCVSDDMKEGGSVRELLKEVFPLAQCSALDGVKCYRQIDIPHPTIPKVWNHISVKTFDQEEMKHSGSTCDRIWINEPLPEKLVGETVGRTRSKEGRGSDGSILMCATILDQADWVSAFEDSQKSVVVRCKGHMYENCVDREVTDEMATEVYQEIGIRLERVGDGLPGYKTGGVLRRSKIESMIDMWARACPHQLQARKSGRPISGGGKIWPSFNTEHHIIRREVYNKIPDGFPMVQITDPHGSRPCATAWAVVLPSDRLVVVDEWPTVEGFGYYESITEKRFFVEQTCEIWRRIEAERGYASKIVARVGDPNRFREPNPHNMQTLHYLYAEQGFDFWIGVNDSLEVGHEEVARYLHFNAAVAEVAPDDPAAWARLMICDNCVNMKRSLQNYGFKRSRDRTKPITDNIDQKFKDFADLARYLVMWHKTNPFAESRTDVRKISDVDKLLISRLPKSRRSSYTTQYVGVNTKGRRRVSSFGSA